MAVLRAMAPVAAVAVAAVTAACGSDSSAGEGRAAPVDTVHVRAEDVPNVIDAIGTAEADNQTTVAAEVGGRVVRIVRDEGAIVMAGDPVIQLDTGDYADEVASAKADLARAEATLRADERLLERYERLIEVGAIDPQTYENLQATVESERAAVQQTEARLTTARRDLGRATVRAPFAGTVGKRHVQLGEYVSDGGGGGGGDGESGLFDLVDARPVRLRFAIPELYMGSIESGDEVRFRVRSDTVSMRVATVDYVSPRIDPETRTFEIRAVYDNEDDAVRPGAYAEVAVTTDVHEGAAVIPEQALITEGNENYVYAARDSVAERRLVRVGNRFGDDVEVLAGVEPGEAVIIAGQHGLQDGAAIRIVARERPTLERE